MLTVVPTPIGNLGDITLRALEVLKSVDWIACEDTRHTKRLLDHYEINARLMALHDHNEEKQIPEVLSKLRNGETMALVSDAGMPLVSDPGFRVMRAVKEADLPVTVLPGASAPITALVASGLPPYPHRFGGFLPVKKGKRGKELSAALAKDETAIYFESPHRVMSTLEILSELAPDQHVVVARELTKKFETIHAGPAKEMFEHFRDHQAKGEIVLLFHPDSA
ncbi:16S rRNA (cytidine(1402)-2'-O)-methyltransferase [Roseibacillus persicicus]|uniref:Ribosomal RNA small subunit methyltransferase I n=1 Tax=Roseibacillus persicicus TaxID=454148 RepID=A0A918TNE9_9BACT|nr:16S rRNA (cytidine(1402)-2'-O)-methyltransferase [Roseibacillus persicicus]MDQ8189342.1 16S rRNA (cytidine(1402)-2'-O)-methyltransferase [Roseibacillus persicicus]GHC55848.1 ribosomal RNA small subunit methyltransferase I [Roseibacillus persicicus]